MGTPEFAVETLQAILDAGHEVPAVVTMPDKPAGRGQKIKMSAVKEFALSNGLRVLQPEKLKDENFIAELRSLNADLQVVVAFRMLPEIVWAMPRLGTINVHASLLPNYRGAAPINWAIINGETKTGVSTFLLRHDIDTGDIIKQESVAIEPNDNAGTIHDKLMHLGAKLAVETIGLLEKGCATFNRQADIDPQTLRPAPKIFKDDMKINWSKNATDVINLIRGLSPYPAAWTEITDVKGDLYSLKIFSAHIVYDHVLGEGKVYSDGKKLLIFGASDHAIAIDELQLNGKKRMDVASLLRGFKIKNSDN